MRFGPSRVPVGSSSIASVILNPREAHARSCPNPQLSAKPGQLRVSQRSAGALVCYASGNEARVSAKRRTNHPSSPICNILTISFAHPSRGRIDLFDGVAFPVRSATLIRSMFDDVSHKAIVRLMRQIIVACTLTLCTFAPNYVTTSCSAKSIVLAANSVGQVSVTTPIITKSGFAVQTAPIQNVVHFKSPIVSAALGRRDLIVLSSDGSLGDWNVVNATRRWLRCGEACKISGVGRDVLAIDGHLVFRLGQDGTVTAYESRSGHTVWRSASLPAASLYAEAGILLVSGSVVARLDEKSGKTLWLKNDAEAFSDPHLVGKSLVVQKTLGGASMQSYPVVCDVMSGRERFSFQYGSPGIDQIVIGQDRESLLLESLSATGTLQYDGYLAAQLNTANLRTGRLEIYDYRPDVSRYDQDTHQASVVTGEKLVAVTLGLDTYVYRRGTSPDGQRPKLFEMTGIPVDTLGRAIVFVTDQGIVELRVESDRAERRRVLSVNWLATGVQLVREPGRKVIALNNERSGVRVIVLDHRVFTAMNQSQELLIYDARNNVARIIHNAPCAKLENVLSFASQVTIICSQDRDNSSVYISHLR